MSATIRENLKPFFDDYLALLDKELPGLIIGFYLHGSLALSAYDPRFSDIDFITVISRPCTENDLDCLKSIHQTLKEKYPSCSMDGSYLQAADLGKFEDAIPPHPYFHDGVLHSSGHHEINAITWWLLKKHGIALRGTVPSDLNFNVEWELLIEKMRHNLDTYWRSFTRDPRRIVWLFSDYGIQWAVLGVLRQFYTFKERDIASKIGAGEYGLQHLPANWHPLIQEAINIRNQSGTSLYKFRLVRAIEAVRFLRFVIRYCNERNR